MANHHKIFNQKLKVKRFFYLYFFATYLFCCLEVIQKLFTEQKKHA